jgi:hypothetical protein
VRTSRLPGGIGSAGVLYGEASAIYLTGFAPLVAAGAAAALVANVILFLSPASPVIALAWTVLVTFAATTTLACAAVVPIAASIRDGSRQTAVLKAVRQDGLRFLAVAASLAIVNALLVLTWVGIPIAAFLTVKAALFGAAVVREEADITDSVTRSWGLVRYFWWRTGRILLGAMAPYLLLAVVLFLTSFPPWADFAMTVAGEGLVAPFVGIVMLLLFEEYQPIADEREEVPPGPRTGN